MALKITEISEVITNDLLSEFDESETFRKIDVEMLILGSVDKVTIIF